MNSYKTIYHRDGTVTIWNVYTQTWQRIAAKQLAADANIMASLSSAERARVEKMARK